MDRMVNQIVEVWGELYEITVHHKSPRVWVAVGDYRGEQIEAKGPTAWSAAKLWQETAQHTGSIDNPTQRK